MKLWISDQSLKIELNTLEKIFSLHDSFTIPLTSISSVSTGHPDSSWWDLRMPGTFLPGVIRAGTYYSKRGKEFWYVTNATTIQIELREYTYRRIILSTSQNNQIAQQIHDQLSK